jgi:hypothetical protein
VHPQLRVNARCEGIKHDSIPDTVQAKVFSNVIGLRTRVGVHQVRQPLVCAVMTQSDELTALAVIGNKDPPSININ